MLRRLLGRPGLLLVAGLVMLAPAALLTRAGGASDRPVDAAPGFAPAPPTSTGSSPGSTRGRVSPVSVTKAAALVPVTGFGSNPGELQMLTYTPVGLPARRPIVVVLHGCGQTAADVDAETGWVKWAEAYRFALVLPQQRVQNSYSRCFDWWRRTDAARTGGEAESIAQMVAWTRRQRASDPTRVFVSGLSAGAAMADVMLASYPDVFAAGAVIAGIPYGCAFGPWGWGGCRGGRVDLTHEQWGALVRAASSWHGPWPRVSIWHGTSDRTVPPTTLVETMQQWTDVHGIDQVPDVTDTVGGFPHAVYQDASGAPRVETYSITGMGHGQPVDPGSGARQCGSAVGYNLDVGLCSSYYIARWFGIA